MRRLKALTPSFFFLVPALEDRLGRSGDAVPTLFPPPVGAEPWFDAMGFSFRSSAAPHEREADPADGVLCGGARSRALYGSPTMIIEFFMESFFSLRIQGICTSAISFSRETRSFPSLPRDGSGDVLLRYSLFPFLFESGMTQPSFCRTRRAEDFARRACGLCFSSLAGRDKRKGVSLSRAAPAEQDEIGRSASRSILFFPSRG